MSRWDRYVLRPRVRAETSGSKTVPHIGPYIVSPESYWFDNLGIFTEGNLLLHCISNLPLGVTNEGREAIKQISGAVSGDSSLQNKGVAHYLLPLLFSLVSLPFSFYFYVLNKK